MSLVSALQNKSEVPCTITTSIEKETVTVLSTTKTKIPKKTKILDEYDYGEDEFTPRVMLPPSKHYTRAGDQLSKEAIYTAKLKYGYYESPANKPTVGFPNANTAAGKAAIYAKLYPKTESAEEPGPVSTEAMSAAKQLGSYVFETMNMENRKKSAQDKLKVEKKELRDKLYSINSASKVYTNSLKPVKVAEKHVDVRKKMDLSKVLDGAEKRAHKRIDKRYIPESENTVQLRKKNALNAAHAVNATDYLPEHLAEERARHAELERQKMEIYTFMTSPKVWQIATSRATTKIDSINVVDSEQLLFGNMEYNKKAVQYAQKKFQISSQKEATTIEKTQGKIYVGGGLWISNRDVDHIARGYVKPLLEKIDAKTEMERELDREIDRRTYKCEDEFEKWKQLQHIRNQNDIELLDETKLKNEEERKGIEASMKKEIADFTSQMEQKLAQKQRELALAEKRRNTLQAKLSSKKDVLQKSHNTQLADWMKINEKDLEKLKLEESDLTRPYYTALDESEDTEKKLQSEINALHIEIKDLRNELEIHDTTISALNNRLEVEKSTSFGEVETGSDTTSHERGGSIISIGHKGKESKKEKHDALLIELDQQKREQEKLAHKKRKKLLDLENGISMREKSLEINREELLIKKERVDMLKSIKQSKDAGLPIFMANNITADDNMSEYSDTDLIKRQNQIAREDDANVIKASEYDEEDGEETDEESNTSTKIHKAEKAMNMGKPTMVNTATIPSQNHNGSKSSTSHGSKNSIGSESVNDAAAPSASVRSVTGVSGVMNESHAVDKQMSQNGNKNRLLKNKIFIGSRSDYEKQKSRGAYGSSSSSQPTAVTVRENKPLLKKTASLDDVSNKSNNVSGKGSVASFSGFSQGSINDRTGKAQPNDVNSSNDEETPLRRESLFKEVF